MSKMTSIERIMISSQGKEPDRVPVAGPITIDWAWGQLYGKDSFMDIGKDPERLANCIVWLCKDVGIDGILAMYSIYVTSHAISEQSGFCFSAPKWRGFVPTDAHRLYEGDPIKDIAYGNPVIKKLSDARKLKPADPYKDENFCITLKAIEIANKRLNGEYGIIGAADDLISICGQLMGWTQLFMGTDKKDEELYQIYRIVSDVGHKSMIAFAKALMKVGVCALGTHSELPPKVGSDKFFKNPEYVHLEYDLLLKYSKTLLNEGNVGISAHACSVGPVDSGIGVWKKIADEIGPAFSIAAAEYGGADALLKIKKGIAPASVMGNLHPIDVMLLGTPSDVEKDSIELIKKCGPGGRFQLCPGCMLPIDTPYENVAAMVNASIKYGQYPIKL